jgi:quercetin dioxygenase-like cupin family protein
MRQRVLWALCFFLCCSATLLAQDDQMVFAAAATSKLANMPGLPTCATAAVQNGDPSKGPAILLVKASAGCTVPWHWHSANENLMVVSGRAKAEMKDGKAVDLKSGDYVKMPGKSVHQFTAVSALMMFVAPDGPFDIHYVDAAGNEIPPDQALSAKAKKKM